MSPNTLFILLNLFLDISIIIFIDLGDSMPSGKKMDQNAGNHLWLLSTSNPSLSIIIPWLIVLKMPTIVIYYDQTIKVFL